MLAHVLRAGGKKRRVSARIQEVESSRSQGNTPDDRERYGYRQRDLQNTAGCLVPHRGCMHRTKSSRARLRCDLAPHEAHSEDQEPQQGAHDPAGGCLLDDDGRQLTALDLPQRHGTDHVRAGLAPGVAPVSDYQWNKVGQCLLRVEDKAGVSPVADFQRGPRRMGPPVYGGSRQSPRSRCLTAQAQKRKISARRTCPGTCRS